jgi:hypothetical protein
MSRAGVGCAQLRKGIPAHIPVPTTTSSPREKHSESLPHRRCSGGTVTHTRVALLSVALGAQGTSTSPCLRLTVTAPRKTGVEGVRPGAASTHKVVPDDTARAKAPSLTP